MKASTLIGAMEHALGKTPNADLSLWDVLNEAGERLFTEQSWNWRVSPPTEIPAVDGQSYIELPSDYGGLIAVTVSGNSPSAVKVVQMPELVARRANSTYTFNETGILYLCFVGVGPGGSDGSNRARVEIHPVAGDDGSPTLVLTYRRRWVEIATNDDDAEPNIPSAWNRALRLLCRCMAADYENAAMGTGPWPEWTAYLAEIERLKIEDGTEQVESCRIRGGTERFLSPTGLSDQAENTSSMSL